MLLSTLLQYCQIEQIKGPIELEVKGLCCDSRCVKPGDVFFALRGSVVDGHRFVKHAIQGGAKVLVLEEDMGVEDGITQVIVANARLTMAKIAQAFYGDPSRELATIGVTGTNGKTTITYLIESMLQCANLAPAVIGTINYRFNDSVVPAPHTTPESYELMEHIVRFKNFGAQSLVMEVSSHALNQYRADGVLFNVAIFSNLTPEHLDYHENMEKYFQSKSRLFYELLPSQGGIPVINIDDPYGLRLAEGLPKALTCGRNLNAHVRFSSLQSTLSGIRGTVVTPNGMVSVESGLIGDYNVENLLCAIGGGVAVGLTPEQICQGISRASQVPGRLEMIENDRTAVILVDYAHTSDALKRVIAALQELGPKRILTVFGCGGDRDRSKRSVMGEVAASGSDITIATSDNPRTENPQQILEDIRSGLERIHKHESSLDDIRNNHKRGYIIIPERRDAIRFAVSLLRPNDVLLVAGKGHEDYQILGRDRIHFDDREELRNALRSGDQL